jgi:hypothetical protein
MAVSGVARPQSGWPVAVFYPFVNPTPYAYGYLGGQLPYIPLERATMASLSAPAEIWRDVDVKTSQALISWGISRHILF